MHFAWHLYTTFSYCLISFILGCDVKIVQKEMFTLFFFSEAKSSGWDVYSSFYTEWQIFGIWQGVNSFVSGDTFVSFS